MSDDSIKDEAPGRETSAGGDWLDGLMSLVERAPRVGQRALVWLPAILAGQRAGRQSLRALRQLSTQAMHEEEWRWPDAPLAELIGALGEVIEALPSAREALPTMEELSELTTELAADPRARALGQEALERLEALTTRALASLVDLAFFATDKPRSEAFIARLTDIFQELERAADHLITASIRGASERAATAAQGSADRPQAATPREHPPTEPTDEEP
ncbi:hypothetical protein DL240_17605 [Lujinxingia litoralis]|uniref:Uncharacterized protein n=1 Tax=Lujinxingia litoralis TaxID=2211119 RepID=A0A328C1D5_9DELT|nr:hypothetical protein [Lujinxingia litoralis]RAL20396.1 hypothetical protein DL240_17605 [Lujinxingia litoralis]